MAVCPNCDKKLRDNFTYCRICGTELSGENPGDFSTEMLNVFNHEDGFIYLFSDKGNQVVLKAGSMDELAVMVHDKKYPWEYRDKSKNSHKNVELVKTPQFESDFLKASSLQKPEVIQSASTFKKVEVKNDKTEEGQSKEFGFSASLLNDRFSFSKSKNQYKPKGPKSEKFWQEKSRMTKEFYQKRTDEINGRLASHNMDKLLR